MFGQGTHTLDAIAMRVRSFVYINTLGGGDDCYETVMFGGGTHTLDAAAMWVRSFVYVIHIL